jgi:integrase
MKNTGDGILRSLRASVLSVEEVALLLRAASGPKYKAAFATAYGAGLRVSEVVALKVGDVALRSAIARCTSAAHRTASTVLVDIRVN